MVQYLLATINTPISESNLGSKQGKTTRASACERLQVKLDSWPSDLELVILY